MSSYVFESHSNLNNAAIMMQALALRVIKKRHFLQEIFSWRGSRELIRDSSRCLLSSSSSLLPVRSIQTNAIHGRVSFVGANKSS